MNRYKIDPDRKLQWNGGERWAIPLPMYRVDGYIVDRWYTPREAPVIPTGWIYEFADGRVVSEAELARVEW